MTALYTLFLDNKKFTLILTIGILLYGLRGIYRMRSESYPQVDFAIAIVTTFYRGASAEDVESRITKPLEDQIREISGIKDVKSTSQSELSTIIVRTDIDNTDTRAVIDELKGIVDKAEGLPSDLEKRPVFEEIKSEEFPIAQIAVTGPNDRRQRDIVAEKIQEEIEDIAEVKDVKTTGLQEREFSVVVDRQKMRRHHISIDEVVEQIQKRNFETPGGTATVGGEQLLVRPEGKLTNARNLGELLVRSNFSGRRILLKDIAEVSDGARDTNVRALYNGGESTLLVVSKKAGADIISTTEKIKRAIDRIEQNHEGPHRITAYQLESDIVSNKLAILANNTLTGFLLVVVILFIFLSKEISLSISLSLPLSLLGTLGTMAALGIALNSITILALVIALGMLVDNAVVIAENHLRLRREGMAPREAALTSLSQLWMPITVTSLTTIAAFLPMLLTKGIMGQFIKWIPVIVTISLLISLAESFFLLPTRLVGLDRGIGGPKTSPWFLKCEEQFERFILWCLNRQYAVCATLLLTTLFSIFLGFFVGGFELFPAEQTQFYLARVEAPKGSTLEGNLEAHKKLSAAIKEKLGGRAVHIISRAGTSWTRPDDPKAKDGDRFGIVFINVDDETKYNADHTRILEELRSIDSSGYAAKVEYEALINGPPIGNDVEATFRSNDKKSLASLVAKIEGGLKGYEGFTDVGTDDIVGDDEIFVEIDDSKAAALGLDTAGIGRTLGTFIAGIDASSLVLENKNVYIHIKSDTRFKEGFEAIGEITVGDSRGNLIPLKSFARTHRRLARGRIKHYDFKPSQTLFANVQEGGPNAAEANRRVRLLFEEHRSAHPDVSLRFGGVAESTQESLTSMW